MKRFLLSMLTIVAMLSCSSEKTTTKFHGIFTDYERVSVGDTVTLRVNGSREDVAMATLDENKQFTITAEVQNQQYYTLHIQDSPITQVILDKNEVTFSYDATTRRFKVEGSRYNEIWRDFQEKVGPLASALYSARTEEESVATQRELLNMIDRSIVENRDNSTSLSMLMEYNAYGGDVKRAEELFKLINPKFEYIAMYQNTKRTMIGKDIIDLTLVDTQGKEVTLSDITKSGKWVLVDFWATWCKTCKGEIPYLVEAYEKYAPAGFEIYCVTFDKMSDKKAWKKFVESNNMNWINVWGTGSNGDWEAGVPYNVNFLPLNFLYSPEGKLVAKGLSGENIDKVLSEYIEINDESENL